MGSDIIIIIESYVCARKWKRVARFYIQPLPQDHQE